MERVRCLLNDSKLSQRFWPEALQYAAAFIYNRIPHSALSGRTPFEVSNDFDIKVDELLKLHVFGSVGYYLKPSQIRSKLENPGHKCLFLGYTKTGTLVLSLPENQIIECRTVYINDNEFLDEKELETLKILNESFSSSETAVDSDSRESTPSSVEQPMSSHTLETRESTSDARRSVRQRKRVIHDDSFGNSMEEMHFIVDKTEKEINILLDTISNDQPTSLHEIREAALLHSVATQSSFTTASVSNNSRTNLHHQPHCFHSVDIPPTEPQNYIQALKDHHWKASMQEELDSARHGLWRNCHLEEKP